MKTIHEDLTEIEKWEIVNQARNFEDLHKAIERISDIDGNIAGSMTGWHYQAMQERLRKVHHDGLLPGILTRAYGIRRQAMALLYSFTQP